MIVDGRWLIGDIGQRRRFLAPSTLHCLIFAIEEQQGVMRFETLV